MATPSKLDPLEYPAAVNKYFDYALVHLYRVSTIFVSGFTMTWHRYFLWLYEEELRRSCDYTGALPYWNFASSSALNTSGPDPVFDGSEFSLSGNGMYLDTGPVVLGPTLSLPQGSGGGCVTQGPFVSLSVV